MIHFDQKRWKQIEEDYSLWWEGTLDRPLIKATIREAFSPEREKPSTPLLSMQNCNCLEYTAEQVIDAIDYELSQYEFLGDAFPFVDFACFGPGVLCGFCGAQMDNHTGGVWYFPKEKLPIKELHFSYDPDNVWAKRIKELYRAGRERWGSNVLMAMPDLGGVQDVLAVFLGNEELMYAMYDEPDEVLRVQEEIRTAFLYAYKDLENELGIERPGYSDWSGLYCKNRSYIFQDDFAYMISPEMFREFALPDIQKLNKEIPNVMYHVDGIGNLNHLDMLLEKTNIQAFQWVYGAGQPSASHWMQVYDKLHQYGKNMEIIGSTEDFEEIASVNPKGLYYHIMVDDKKGTAQNRQAYKDCLNDYHIVGASEKKGIEELIDRWR